MWPEILGDVSGIVVWCEFGWSSVRFDLTWRYGADLDGSDELGGVLLYGAGGLAIFASWGLLVVQVPFP